MIDSPCPIYWIDPTILGEADNPPPADQTCSTCGCNCGYIQFESLISYLDELKYAIKQDADNYNDFEFKLRQQIVEISRLFDMEANVEPGYFTKTHYSTTKIYSTNGTKYMYIPQFVLGTLEVRTNNNFLLSESTYAYKDGYLVYMPCQTHMHKVCSSGCIGKNRRKELPWPQACYKITARWGRDCADAAVQKAVRDYLIEGFRVQDPVVTVMNGIPISRLFKVPHSWTSYITNFKAKRKIYSQFQIA